LFKINIQKNAVVLINKTLMMTLLEILIHNMFRFIIIVGIYSIIDYYAWTGIKTYFVSHHSFQQIRSLYLVSSIITIVGFLLTISMYMNGRGVQSSALNLFIGIVFIIILPKLFLGFALFIEDICRILASTFQWIRNNEEGWELIPRYRLFTIIGMSIALLMMLIMIKGVFFNKYRYKVKKVTLYFDNLPSSFDGYKLVQISDIHSGSFDNKEKVEKGIELINAQNPDLVLFTGDMVNMRSEEFIPYIPVFAKIKARDGKFSILGNHDYGDYIRFNSPLEKWKNLQMLEVYEHRAGFNLLLNQHQYIKKGTDSIFIAGVENWGKFPFPKRGKLDVAINGIPNAAFIVLLSHDPSHWDLEVTKQSKNIALTLSGHTHGMQFGIDFHGFKWSPVQWKYPLWGGLFHRNGMKLYVNVGFGFIGFPGRVGILPEITVITLKRK